MADAELVFQVAEMFVQIVCRVIPERTFEYRAVTVAAGIWTAAAGNAARVRRLGIVENRQHVSFRITGQLFVCRKREAVQVKQIFTIPGKNRFGRVTVYKSFYLVQVLSVAYDEFVQGFFTFTGDNKINSWE